MLPYSELVVLFDIVLRSGVVIDGTGKPRYKSDIGIKDGRIVELGQKNARRNGIDVNADQYPYIGGQTGLYAILPPWVQEGGLERLVDRLKDSTCRERIKLDIAKGIPGWQNWIADVGWDNVMVVALQTEQNKSFESRRIDEIARMRGQSTAEALFDILVEEEARASMVVFCGSEDDVKDFMRRPWVMIGSDHNGIKPSEGPLGGRQDPRAYGTFPRILGRYVREHRIFTIEEAIRKMTSLPAQKLGLKDRGLIHEGSWADIVVFDSLLITDRATYEDPAEYSQGVEYVLVNGQVVFEKGTFTGERPEGY